MKNKYIEILLIVISSMLSVAIVILVGQMVYVMIQENKVEKDYLLLKEKNRDLKECIDNKDLLQVTEDVIAKSFEKQNDKLKEENKDLANITINCIYGLEEVCKLPDSGLREEASKLVLKLRKDIKSRNDKYFKTAPIAPPRLSLQTVHVKNNTNPPPKPGRTYQYKSRNNEQCVSTALDNLSGSAGFALQQNLVH